MSFTIPSGLFNAYKTACDELINNENIGENITLVYPSLPSLNPTSGPQLVVGGTPNTNLFGNPGTFNPSFGTNLKQTSAEETIRVRKYHNPKDWARYVSLNVPRASVLVIGFIGDLPKIERATEVKLLNDEQPYGSFRYKLASQPFPWGMNQAGRHHYFAAFLETV